VSAEVETATESAEQPRWLTPGVGGIGLASLLCDLGHANRAASESAHEHAPRSGVCARGDRGSRGRSRVGGPRAACPGAKRAARRRRAGSRLRPRVRVRARDGQPRRDRRPTVRPGARGLCGHPLVAGDTYGVETGGERHAALSYVRDEVTRTHQWKLGEHVWTLREVRGRPHRPIIVPRSRVGTRPAPHPEGALPFPLTTGRPTSVGHMRLGRLSTVSADDRQRSRYRAPSMS
jgi:hypothetical protein